MTKQTNNTQPVRKPAKRKNAAAAIGASDIPEGNSMVLTKIPGSLDDIKMSKRGKSVGEYIRAEQSKLVKHAESIIHGYCNIGRALFIAKETVVAAKGNWQAFMKDKPLGIAHSTAERYILAHSVGADNLIGAAKTLEGPFNFKDSLSLAQVKKRKAEGNPREGDDEREAKLLGKGKKTAERSPRTDIPQEPQPGGVGGHTDIPNASGEANRTDDAPGSVAVSDVTVDNWIQYDVDRLTKSQAQRLLLAIETRLADIAESESVIEHAA